MQRRIGAQPVANKGGAELAIAIIGIGPSRRANLKILHQIAPGSGQLDLLWRSIKQHEIGPRGPLHRHYRIAAQFGTQPTRKPVATRGHKISRLKLEDLLIVLTAVANCGQIRPGHERFQGDAGQAATCQFHLQRRPTV